MTPSRLPGCVWRGAEGDGTSFECLHPENKKTVTPEICQVCPLRQEAHVVRESAIEHLAHGVAGLTKAALGIDKASDGTVQKRWDICKSCEFYKLWRCTDCGCLVSAKIRLASEVCPQNKWGPENAKVD